MSLRIVFTLTNNVDSYEMQHNAAFHLGLHCLSKCPFRGFQYTKGKVNEVVLYSLHSMPSRHKLSTMSTIFVVWKFL